MAFIGDFQAVLDQLQQNRKEPLQQFLLKRSNMGLEDIRDYEDFIRIKPFTKGELSQLQTQNPPFAGLIDRGRISKIFQSPGPIYNVKGEAFTYYPLSQGPGNGRFQCRGHRFEHLFPPPLPGGRNV